MGQEIGVTPIQLISAVSAIANGGVLIKPHVVQQIKRSDEVLMSAAVSAGEPRRVIRPETAATLRRLMEGVVLNGTGPLARLDGWSAAGKTGSAQKIDPATGRYSPTQLIASFTGFAPTSNPAITILVSLDSPVGLHEGGQVAAPVFKRVAEQVLAYLDVPRDVPLNARLIQAAYKRQNAAEANTLEDFSPTDFSGQPDALPLASNPAEPEPEAHAPEVAMSADEGGDVAVPDFSGKTMREVTEICLHLGLEPLLVGSNLAVEQHPEAGTQVRRGTKVTVQFGNPAPQAASSRLRHTANSEIGVPKATKAHTRSRR
jgi:membrane peptidoglycan carboxypeptidase